MKIPSNTLFPLFRYKRNIIRIKISGLPVNFKMKPLKMRGFHFRGPGRGDECERGWCLMWTTFMTLLCKTFVTSNKCSQMVTGPLERHGYRTERGGCWAGPLLDVGTRIIFMPGRFMGGYKLLADPGMFRWRVSAPWHGSNVSPAVVHPFKN